MKKYRILLHVDLNAFFASCEEAENPALRDKPIGIGKDSDRGILTTANYVARRFGVSSAMPVAEARKRCPNLLVLPGNMALYQRYSETFFEYLRTITDQVEPASIDEAYLDITELADKIHPMKLAEKIQKTLHDNHRLPVSIGIGPNRFLAKMASDMKKPLGITVLRKRDVKEKLWPLPIERMVGIGRKTVPDLKLIGIRTIGDLANYKDRQNLNKFLGNQTDAFVGKAHGEGSAYVDPSRAETVHSIGNSKTYENFLHDYASMMSALERLTEKVVERLNKKNLAAKNVGVQLRTSEYVQRSKQLTLPQHTTSYDVIFEAVEHLFDDLYEDKPVHLLGVSVAQLTEQANVVRQLNIFEAKEPLERDTHISKLLESINRHYDKPLLNKGIKK